MPCGSLIYPPEWTWKSNKGTTVKISILGKKIGMTQIFTDEGKFVPVTVIEAGPCSILKVTKDKILMGFDEKKESRVSKPEAGKFKKAKSSPKYFVKEVPYVTEDRPEPGTDISVDVFQEKDFVDVSGTSIGKGFQGGVKRWGWSGGPKSHGSMHHRRVGSIGGSSFPSRVWKGHKIPGRMGNTRKTVQNLEVIKIIKEKNLMLVKGPVPGADNGYLEIRTAKKKPLPARAKKEEKQEDRSNESRQQAKSGDKE